MRLNLWIFLINDCFNIFYTIICSNRYTRVFMNKKFLQEDK